jgi:hypothetical protein
VAFPKLFASHDKMFGDNSTKTFCYSLFGCSFIGRARGFLGELYYMWMIISGFGEFDVRHFFLGFGGN